MQLVVSDKWDEQIYNQYASTASQIWHWYVHTEKTETDMQKASQKMVDRKQTLKKCLESL